MDAVGVPAPELLINANRAADVLVAPKSKSSLILTGEILPLFLCQKLVKTLPPLLISPVQSRLPLLLVTVQPVLPTPPAKRTFPVVFDPLAILTSPVDPPA